MTLASNAEQVAGFVLVVLLPAVWVAGAGQAGENTDSTTITPAEGISITITVNCPGACTGGDE